MADFHGLFTLKDKIHVTDIGAAAIAEKPIYMSLVETQAAYLSVFDGDQRQSDGITAAFGDQVTHYEEFIFDDMFGRVVRGENNQVTAMKLSLGRKRVDLVKNSVR